MSFIKLSQIIDQSSSGLVYIENEDGIVLNSNNPVFPLQVLVEVVEWVDEAEQKKHDKIISFNSESISIPDQNISIRQSAFNQLVSKYPNLVI